MCQEPGSRLLYSRDLGGVTVARVPRRAPPRPRRPAKSASVWAGGSRWTVTRALRTVHVTLPPSLRPPPSCSLWIQRRKPMTRTGAHPGPLPCSPAAHHHVPMGVTRHVHPQQQVPRLHHLLRQPNHLLRKAQALNPAKRDPRLLSHVSPAMLCPVPC